MQRLILSHTGTFSERASGLFRAIIASNGSGELGSGIGLLPESSDLGVLISFNDDFSTAFRLSEVKGLIEIISETTAEEDPYSRKVGAIFDHLVPDLTSLAEEVERIERAKTAERLNNETTH